MTAPATPVSRQRRVEVRTFPPARHLVVAAERAGRRMTAMHGLVDLDVTEARRRLAAQQPPMSFTAFIVSCVARAAAAHPEVHAYRSWGGRLVLQHHADVAVIVEVEPQGPFPMAHLVRDADRRTVGDIGAELHAIRDAAAAARD